MYYVSAWRRQRMQPMLRSLSKPRVPLWRTRTTRPRLSYLHKGSSVARLRPSQNVNLQRLFIGCPGGREFPGQCCDWHIPPRLLNATRTLQEPSANLWITLRHNLAVLLNELAIHEDVFDVA